ncbi:Anhydro-N-acetylmuramic acid kinase [Winogradskyella psychrotolerans RS-3]|uniref:Anhydro-N-acetylmuramic acid kinase n=1 Tax=Winogradskyella psychrotolerans RS-3 TaxID=641526 RepID=S7XDS7_9FLAO|nr:anhydro-N-acetylmuramic acid kinase [Winogradskyella psychrotolerans]EPR74153.1 Anhydro-N-acetylmuramic acid kinase [Winogradskyella psychrotolerans RS-3]
MAKYNYNVIGVMSGTSLDGIDLIYATYDVDTNWDFKIHYAETIKYSTQWKTVLGGLVNQSMNQLQAIDSEYSEYLATVISTFIKTYKIEDIDFISSHGHTALHQPQQGLTYQIGNQQILADILNKNVICDFRVEDVQLGGQGAPLVPIGDRLLFNNFNYCLNLGGFANVSFDYKNERIAYDICPVNIVLNHYVAKLNLEFDDKGQLASTGKVNKDLLLQLNALHYYREQPPKSLGLEWVDINIFPLIESYNLKTEDILRTFVEHVAIQISNVLVEKNTRVLITGGGVYNSFLIDRLKHFSIVEIVIPQNEIIEFKEALIFGLLGVLKKRNEINCLKSVTGAKRNHSSGKILIPKNRI